MASVLESQCLAGDERTIGARNSTFASRARTRKKARRSVLIMDKIADWTITVGGILVIVAVLGILVFLVAETLPLFKKGTISGAHEYLLDPPPHPPLAMAIDEYKTIVFLLSKDGEVSLFHAKTGARIEPPLIDFNGKQLTSFSRTLDHKNMAFGFSDGTIRFARIQFISHILPADQLPEGLAKLDERDSTDGSAVYSKIPGNQFRKISSHVEIEDEFTATKAGKTLVGIAYQLSGEAERQTRALVAVDRDGLATLSLAESKINLLSGKRRTEIEQTELPPLPKNAPIHSILLSEKADQVIVADRAGTVYRYNTRDLKNPFLAEITHVLPKGTELNIFEFLLGNQSIVVGDTEGSLNIYFLVEGEEVGTRDGRALQLARRFDRNTAPLVKFDQSGAGKSFATADAEGHIQVLHGISQKTLVNLSGGPKKTEYREILLSPRMDGLVALQTDGRVRFWEFSVPHPETTFRILFRKVWYEGYPKPSYMWQSSAATDDYEPKFSLIPLIFGTIKAAFYSLLFAIPVAISAAIFTSEFVHNRVRSFVKPTMEMMASLPSVVLGFVAALVMAPVVETWVAAIILAFVVVPIALMLAAYLWQMIPLPSANRLEGIQKFGFITLVLISAIFVAIRLGPWFETLLFEGDFKAWVNRDSGGPEPFLFLLGLPVSFVMVTVMVSRLFGRRIAFYMARVRRFQAALLDILRWLAVAAGTVLCSYALARLLGLLGLDVRGSFVGTYVQRNTLIVGFAMGFAVIPIIYTIAEDALNAVPEHLRAASLGCGATTWQTAIFVVLPTAVSGVFSAIMIGMGRAVGETMIVVMSAGNTPLLDWNVFNGLRALSATIAVELPEAVKDGTLYRILFLSGLILFVMTFVINTVAEVVRLRFRKRAMQL